MSNHADAIGRGSEFRRPRPPDAGKDVRSRADRSDEARSAEKEKPDKSAEVLKRVADKAFEHPPKDLLRLSASASKYLLTNLEPAMKIAEEVRRQVSRERPDLSVEIVNDERREEAMHVLSDDRSSDDDAPAADES